MPTRVLYAEDEPATRTLVCEQLAEGGYDIQGVEDGAQAIAMIEKETFDVVLLDIRMPGVDGLEVLRFMKEKKIRPRVIMLTAVEDLSIAINAVKLGATDYLTKPFSLDALQECMKKVLQK
jgi:DNA-binding response OmpR family regulator